MANGIIVRVPKGIELSPLVLSVLGKKFPDHILETYDNKKPDTHRSFARRIDSLHSAFSFILDAYPFPLENTFITKETLKGFADEYKKASKGFNGSLDEEHKELEFFTAKLLELLCFNWNLTSVKDAIALLNEAEQFVLMQQGRFDLATLMPVQPDNDIEFVIQWDESLPPYYDQLLEELKQIKAQKYPKTPAWFHALEEYKQAYFCNLDQKIETHTEVVHDFNNFLLKWTDIKSRSLNIGVELQQIVSGLPPLPSWFNELSPQQREMMRVLANDPSNVDKNLSQFKKMITSSGFKKQCVGTLAQVSSIPQWYWVLPDHQQYFLEHTLKRVPKVEDAVSFLSSRHRTFPAPANLATHSFLAVHRDGTVRELSGKRYRSSHIASRDVLDQAQAVQQRHVDSNLAKVMERAKPEQLALLQTLISPISVPLLSLPDLELYNLARAAVKRRENFQTILQNNHPYNIAKIVLYTKADDKDSLALLSIAKRYVSSTPGLQALLDQYRSVLNSAIGTASVFDYAGRELFLSSLEELIILTMSGYSYGSCVSGKDRKAIELLHTDAMILYKELYGIWPVFEETMDKENRIRFVSLVADLYMTRHQHEHAGQNAPGSEGLKTPEMYLPTDIVAEINRRLGRENAIRDDDRLATDNEVKNIFSDLEPKGVIGGVVDFLSKVSTKIKSYFLPKNTLFCQLVANQLGEGNCTKLYDALNPLINEKSQFIPSPDATWQQWKPAKFFSGGKKAEPEVEAQPEGIEKIRKLMLDPSSGKDNVKRLAKILQVIVDRPQNDSSRTEATNSVYDNLRSLLDRDASRSDIFDSITKTVEDWTRLFNLSKEAHSNEVVSLTS